LPYDKWISKGYFEVKESFYVKKVSERDKKEGKEDEKMVRKTTYVTQRGLAFLIHFLKRRGYGVEREELELAS
jgi:hypothetical protein